MRPGVRPARRNSARLRMVLAAFAAVMIFTSSGLGGPGGLGLEGSEKPAAEDWHAQQTPNLEASQRLLDTFYDQQGAAPLARAIVLAEAVTNEQARLGGVYLSAPVGLPGHQKPSAALAALLERHQTTPSVAQRRAMAALDDLGEPLGPGLTRMINAYLSFEAAAFDAFAFADLNYLQKAADRDPPGIEGMPPASMVNGTPPLVTLRNAGIDVAPVMTARSSLLEAAVYLQWAGLVTTRAAPETHAAAAAGEAAAGGECPGEPGAALSVPSVVAIDVTGTDNCYSSDYLLIIDMNGADTYKGNAGNVVIDLGEDSDIHSTRNGGADKGAGFLLDDGGNDTYIGGAGGSNGGARTGIGFLLDAGDGNDTYIAGDGATNGGALSGVGTLIDTGGNDSYTAGGDATNGGGSVSLGLPATGFLFDGGGDDAYRGGRLGTNGGSTGGSLGYLLDAGHGTDSYASEGAGSNGGGLFGIGFLYDVGGDGDSYVIDGRADHAGNGAGGLTAAPSRADGRRSPAPGAGLLLDGDGKRDTYRDSDAESSGSDVTKVPKGSVGAQVDRCSSTNGSAAVDDLVRAACPS